MDRMIFAPLRVKRGVLRDYNEALGRRMELASVYVVLIILLRMELPLDCLVSNNDQTTQLNVNYSTVNNAGTRIVFSNLAM